MDRSARAVIYMMKAGAEGRRWRLTSGVRRALRYLPRMHGMRNGLSVGRALCAAHRGNAGSRSSIHHQSSALANGLFRQLLFLVLPFPARLRLVVAWPMGLAHRYLRRQPRLLCAGCQLTLRNLIALAPVARPGNRRLANDTRSDCGRRRRRGLRVGLTTGCVQRVFFSQVNQATARVLVGRGDVT